MGGATLIRQAASNWSVSGVATIQTGVPHTITDSPGGSIFGFASTSRAQLCPGVTYDNISTPGSVSSRINNYCNTAAFCAVPMIGNGNRLPGAGIVRGADQNNIDLWITKRSRLPSVIRSNCGPSFFNALNHVPYSTPATAFGAASFGVIGSTSVIARLIQFALRYNFLSY